MASEGDAQADFFFYGTLMDPDVRRAVLGRVVPARAAVARGYRAYRHAVASYPVLRPDRLGAAAGLVVSGLAETDVARLHWYEGDEYTARRIEVILPGRRRGTAWAFVGTDRVPVTRTVWTLADWQARHKRPFLARLGRVGARA